MLVEGLLALAALAGQTVVTAATTDAWEACRQGFARLLGRGDSRKEQLAEQRLEETREQLTAAEGADLDRIRAAQAAEWQTRLADLLEEDPDVEAELRALVEQIRGQLAASVVSATDHSVAAGGNVNISANSRGGAARDIWGGGGSGGTHSR